MLVVGIMDPAMVEAAQGDGVGEIGPTASAPRFSMMEFAPGVRPLASIGGAVLVDVRERGAPIVFRREQVEQRA